MRKEVKRIPFAICYLLMAVFVLTGCVREAWLAEGSEERVPVLFSSGFGTTVTTRVGGETGCTWSASDMVGVYMIESGANSINVVGNAANKCYRAATGGSTKTDLLPHPDTIYYPEHPVCFILYHPYTTALNGYAFPVDLSDQSAQEALDLIYVHDQTPCDKYKGKVEVTFHHQLSKLVFLIGGRGQSSLSGLTFDIGGVASQTTFNLSTGTLADPGTGGTETLNAQVSAYIGDSVRAEAIVLPMADITATPVPLSITLNGKEYTATLPPVDGFSGIEAGYRYIYIVSLDDGSLRLTGVATPWNTVRGGDIPVDEEKPAPSPAPPMPPLVISSMDMAYIPAGVFRMGSPVNEPGRNNTNEMLHKVTLTKGFFMSIYETTNAQYAEFLSAIGADEDGNAMVNGSELLLAPTVNMAWDGDSWEVTAGYEEHPVAGITWYAATAFADWAGGSLPTDAQWEYACRAGSQMAWSFGSNESNLGDYAWYAGNSGGELHAVGQKLPNAWGLYDMHGNVWEWCSDRYANDLGYDPVVDPIGIGTGNPRSIRGGGYSSNAADTRSARRTNSSYYYPYLGFRIVVNLP
jgi:formylglycine-generating enzyme required for sulfatase activity